jgi:hypothetical protein
MKNIQATEYSSLDVNLVWLSPTQIRVSFKISHDELGTFNPEFVLAPEELAYLSDYIDDVLAR